MKETIKIKDVICESAGITQDEGKKINNMIAFLFWQSTDVVLDFEGIEFTCVAFLHALIGDLYSLFSARHLSECLSYVNVNEVTKIQIMRISEQGARRSVKAFKKRLQNQFN